MPLNIKDDHTHELARQLARRKGTSIAKAVKEALSQALLLTQADSSRLKEDLDRIAVSMAARQPRDRRNAEEIIGYDDTGLPA